MRKSASGSLVEIMFLALSLSHSKPQLLPEKIILETLDSAKNCGRQLFTMSVEAQDRDDSLQVLA
jgi:hypothetical protein